MEERYKWLKEHGICVSCGQRDAFQGHVRCSECIEKNYLASARCWDDKSKREKYNQQSNKSRKEKYEKRKTAGLCVKCGKPAKNGVYCERCREKRNAQRRSGRSPGEHFRERIKKGVCIYCEGRVVPGHNFCEKHLEERRKNMEKINSHASSTWRKEIANQWKTAKSIHSKNG